MHHPITYTDFLPVVLFFVIVIFIITFIIATATTIPADMTVRGFYNRYRKDFLSLFSAYFLSSIFWAFLVTGTSISDSTPVFGNTPDNALTNSLISLAFCNSLLTHAWICYLCNIHRDKNTFIYITLAFLHLILINSCAHFIYATFY